MGVRVSETERWCRGTEAARGGFWHALWTTFGVPENPAERRAGRLPGGGIVDNFPGSFEAPVPD